MENELLITRRAMSTLASLSRVVQRRIEARFDELERFPYNSSEFQETDAFGRLLDVSLCAGYAIYYWVDLADRHVKVLAIRKADRAR